MNAILSKPTRENRIALVNFWALSPTIIDNLSEYFLIRAPGIDIMDMVEQGEIKHDSAEGSVWYKVNWLETPAVCYRNGRCILSFRRWNGMDTGYVLIQTEEKCNADRMKLEQARFVEQKLLSI